MAGPRHLALALALALASCSNGAAFRPTSSTLRPRRTAAAAASASGASTSGSSRYVIRATAERPAAGSRREALQGGLSSLAAAAAASGLAASGLAVAPGVARADDEMSGSMVFDESGRVISGGGGTQEEMEKKATASQKTTNREQGMTYVTPSAWERVSTAEGGTFVDKFSKDPICTGVYIKKTPSTLGSIKDLGKLENIRAPEALGLDKELVRADLVNAAKSLDFATDSVYFKWDLALAPKVCGANEQFGGALGCSYDRITLLSATVAGGNLMVLQVEANAQQWKDHGTSLKLLRDSFVAAGDPAPAAAIAPPSAPPPPPSLPPGDDPWEPVTQDGKTFYYNKKTGESSWSRP